jgi:hypothetical protein
MGHKRDGGWYARSHRGERCLYRFVRSVFKLGRPKSDRSYSSELRTTATSIGTSSRTTSTRAASTTAVGVIHSEVCALAICDEAGSAELSDEPDRAALFIES